MDNRELIPQLYREQYSKMVSLLCNRFGIDQMDAAEDIVSETFLAAAESWGLKGVPDDPVAWLYKVAKNNTLNELKHERVFRQRVKGELMGQDMKARLSGQQAEEWDWDFSPGEIADSQLRMLFAVCHPVIPVEAQVSLALRVLCGFTIDEIAQALLTTRANINKRLYRGKERLRSAGIQLAVPAGPALDSRLDAVLLVLYLLFNEGYYSASPDKVLRKDLCREAMRLCFLLSENRQTGRADVLSLLALMCFQASRLDARVDEAGGLVLYEQQDSSRWDQELIHRGNGLMEQACGQGLLSRYHFEAAIAWWHTNPGDSPEKWENILLFYNRLLILEYSPIAALNRAYAFARVYGKEKAIPEAEGLGLEGNLFYHSLLGELYSELDNAKAAKHFEKALSLSGTDAEKAVMAAKLAACRKG